MASNEIRRRELAKLETAGRKITPLAVFKAARAKDHPLHDEFEWDGRRAVEALGIIRARDIISSVRVEITVQDQTICVPIYVEDVTKEPGTQGYQAVEQIQQSDEDVANESLQHEFNLIEGCVVRLKSLAIAFIMEPEFYELLAKLSNLKKKIRIVKRKDEDGDSPRPSL